MPDYLLHLTPHLRSARKLKVSASRLLPTPAAFRTTSTVIPRAPAIAPIQSPANVTVGVNKVRETVSSSDASPHSKRDSRVAARYLPQNWGSRLTNRKIPQ